MTPAHLLGPPLRPDPQSYSALSVLTTTSIQLKMINGVNFTVWSLTVTDTTHSLEIRIAILL